MTNTGEDVKIKTTFYSVSGNANWFSHYEKQYEVSSKIQVRTIM